VDVTYRSTDVTLSWNKFKDHDKVILVSHAPDATFDTVIRVTMHHNWFLATGQRHPRLRFGKVHSFNNVLSSWVYYGGGSSMSGQLLSENNVYEAGVNKQALLGTNLGSDPEPGFARSKGDLLLNGAMVEEGSPEKVFDAATLYGYTPELADQALRTKVEAQAGWR
jgi:pectate lyase